MGLGHNYHVCVKSFQNIALLFGLAGACAAADTEKNRPFPEHVARSTVKLGGPGSTGTGFLVAKPTICDNKSAALLLITAEHVLSKMKGENAEILLRKHAGDGYEKFPLNLRIRDGERPL